jgi:flagellar biosynthesis/type III secretory pathway protein FliH
MSDTISLAANVRGFIPISPARRPPAAADPGDALRRAVEGARREAAETAARERDATQAVQRRHCENCGGRFEAFLAGLKKETGERVIGLALELAEAIVRHRLPDADMLRTIMEETLESVGDSHGAKVRMNRADAQALRSGTPQAPPLPVSDAIQIVEDPTLAPGDIFIESRNGCFDGRLSQRLETLKQRLLERYRNDNATQPGI